MLLVADGAVLLLGAAYAPPSNLPRWQGFSSQWGKSFCWGQLVIRMFRFVLNFNHVAIHTPSSTVPFVVVLNWLTMAPPVGSLLWRFLRVHQVYGANTDVGENDLHNAALQSCEEYLERQYDCLLKTCFDWTRR